jgi:RNA polymerase sigma factor (sigma-70 family)
VTLRAAWRPALLGRLGTAYYPAMSDADLSELVGAAAQGDQRAWEGLVERFSGLVWSVARAYGLREADAADVAQTAWLRLVEHLHRVRDPQRVGAWLATTARHEALRMLRVVGRQLPVGDDAELEPSDAVPVTPESQALASEQRSSLWGAFATLPSSCQRLLRVLMADPPPSYQEAAAALDMPIGSIGPTRRRCLERLRRLGDL